MAASSATVNNALAAVDDFSIRRGLGPASAARVEITAAVPRALDQRAQLRYLREVQRCPSPRDQALALVPFYAGARISEIVARDVDDIARSARRGILRIFGKGQRARHMHPDHPQLRAASRVGLKSATTGPAPRPSPALSLNQRGQRPRRPRHRHRHRRGRRPRRPRNRRRPAPTPSRRPSYAAADLVIIAELLGHLVDK